MFGLLDIAEPARKRMCQREKSQPRPRPPQRPEHHDRQGGKHHIPVGDENHAGLIALRHLMMSRKFHLNQENSRVTPGAAISPQARGVRGEARLRSDVIMAGISGWIPF